MFLWSHGFQYTLVLKRKLITNQSKLFSKITKAINLSSTLQYGKNNAKLPERFLQNEWWKLFHLTRSQYFLVLYWCLNYIKFLNYFNINLLSLQTILEMKEHPFIKDAITIWKLVFRNGKVMFVDFCISREYRPNNIGFLQLVLKI